MGGQHPGPTCQIAVCVQFKGRATTGTQGPEQRPSDKISVESPVSNRLWENVPLVNRCSYTSKGSRDGVDLIRAGFVRVESTNGVCWFGSDSRRYLRSGPVTCGEALGRSGLSVDLYIGYIINSTRNVCTTIQLQEWRNHLYNFIVICFFLDDHTYMTWTY